MARHIAFGFGLLLTVCTLPGLTLASAQSTATETVRIQKIDTATSSIGLAALQSSETAETPAPSAFSRLSSVIGGMRRVGSYVSNVSREMGTVTAQEIAVSRQYRCLAQAVYFEGRGEPAVGQQAIAHVILNRVRDSRYPSTICGVVYQNQGQKNRCQFSFACDGLSDKPHDTAAWQRSLKVALEALTGIAPDVTRASTHFHATHVEPLWAENLRPTVKLGQHMFYQVPNRQQNTPLPLN